jgi:hypothetical protein
MTDLDDTLTIVGPPAHTVSAFRMCTEHPRRHCPCHTYGVSYTAMLETSGAGAVAALVAAAHEGGHLADRLTDSVGVLDILTADGDLLADHFIPSEESWQWWVTAAGLRVADVDCPICNPDR